MLAQKILSLTVYSFDWGCGSNSANRYNLILSSTQKKKKNEEENEFANSQGFDFCFGGGEGVNLCFGGRRRETVEEREKVCILFVKGEDQEFGELVWALA